MRVADTTTNALRLAVAAFVAGLVAIVSTPAIVSAEETTTTVPGAPVDTVPGDPGSGDPASGTAIDPVTGLPVAMGPLIIVPAGCAQPTPALAVFRGVVTAFDDPDRPAAARLQVVDTLAGSFPESIDPTRVDVSLGTEARFLTVGDEYIVGVKVDASTGLLASVVGEPQPMFGGDAVIGLDDVTVDCPTLPDPIRVLHADGSAVDTSVLAPLHGEGASILRALLLPFVIALGALIALVVVKQLFVGAVRAANDPSGRR